MAKISVLDNNTIDKIAAGEVVERPMNIVKELVENAIDAGATIITVEIRNGGLKMIRVTDNGSGIESDQIRNAFLSHATSKITNASDLNSLYTLGFRGEALSSIAAVSRVEITSCTEGSLTGVHYQIEGGHEIKNEEVGAPKGTTIIIRDVFFNTLPRLKFLKSESTEGSYISDLMLHLALSMPHISFIYINNGQTKLSTSGRGDLKEVIYRIFGKEVSSSIRYIEEYNSELQMSVKGYLGLPRLNRSNRAGEILFINHRYVKSKLLTLAVEKGYIEYLMQHKFPFFVLDIEFSPEKVDVNVHPTKQEVRLSEEHKVFNAIEEYVSAKLAEKEMIDSISAPAPKEEASRISIPQQFEQNRIIKEAKAETIIEAVKAEAETKETKAEIKEVLEAKADNAPVLEIKKENTQKADDIDSDVFFEDRTETDSEPNINNLDLPKATVSPTLVNETEDIIISDYKQIELTEDKTLLSPKARLNYKIIGQLFKTYWLIEYDGSLLIMDQHAAHEKVMFEHFMKYLNDNREIPSQTINPPAVMSMSNHDKQIVFDNIDRFSELGFVIEDFGEREIMIRSIPMELYGNNPINLIAEIVEDLSNMHKSHVPDSIRTRIATMACKAAIKGNNTVTVKEIEELLDEMLTLDNPYNCPHGRPTMITMSEAELEKRFHRIV